MNSTNRKRCECGCGGLAPIAVRNDKRRGWKKGKPKRFISGHNVSHRVHGMVDSAEYEAYLAAKKRCAHKWHKSYKNYGGRGIKFLFVSFREFIDDIGKKPDPKLSLDRIDNNKHYEPGNVRWATWEEQARNRRRMRYSRTGRRLW